MLERISSKSTSKDLLRGHNRDTGHNNNNNDDMMDEDEEDEENTVRYKSVSLSLCLSL